MINSLIPCGRKLTLILYVEIHFDIIRKILNALFVVILTFALIRTNKKHKKKPLLPFLLWDIPLVEKNDPDAKALRRHDMKIFSALLAISVGSPVGSSRKAPGVWSVELCCWPAQAIEQTLELPLIWEAMKPNLFHCNRDGGWAFAYHISNITDDHI